MTSIVAKQPGGQEPTEYAAASTAVGSTPEAATNRATFLMTMYTAMWDNINRHILVGWQSVTALFAALAAVYLAEQGSINMELAATFVTLTAGWSVAHTIDARGWFNRNMHIITNIERLFLVESDEREVHYFFQRGPRTGTIEHLLIQSLLGWSIWLLALSWHFSTRIWPGFSLPWSSFRIELAMPYVAAVSVLLFVRSLRRRVERSETTLHERSPGKDRVAH